MYVARAHPYDAHNWTSFAYGGTHATLLQRRTVGELLTHVLRKGAMGTDVALCEERLDATTSAHGATRPIRSYALFTPLVGVGKQQYNGWRSELPVGRPSK